MVLVIENTVFTIISAVLFIFLAVYTYFIHCFTYWKQLGVPYLEPSFPFGNIKKPLLRVQPMGIFLADAYNEMKAKGYKYFGIYFFQNPRLVLVDADLIKSVMSRDFGHFYDRGIYHDDENDPLRSSLVNLEGQKWKNLRAKLTPVFSSGKLKNIFQVLVDCSLELKNCLNESIQKGKPIDIKEISIHYTTNVVGSCAFGIECNSFQNPNSDFILQSKNIFSPTGLDRVKLFMSYVIPNIVRLLKLRVTNKKVDSFYRNLVKDTIEYREKNNVTRNDFMQLLIQLKNEGMVEDEENNENKHNGNKENKVVDFKFSLNTLSAQVYIFFVAGFETSSTTMTWTLFELSVNPEIQDKVRNEIIRVLKKHNGKITYDALLEMHYMERVIQETNVVLRKGTVVFISNYGIQRDSEYYPDPEKFDPDRFLEENKSSRPDYTWLPFGDGPRVCIGLRFAMMETKVGLMQLLLNYKFTLNEKTVNPPVLDGGSLFSAFAKDKILLNAERV